MQELARQVAGQGGDAPTGALSADAMGRARAQLAADLHDDLLQVLAGTCARVERLCDRTRLGGVEPAELLDEMTATVVDLRAAENRLRSIVGEALDADRDPSLLDRLRARGQVLATQAGFTYSLLDDRSVATPRPVAQALLHIGLEALENAARHAQPSRVTVEFIDFCDGVQLRVEDDGVGIELGRPSPPHHVGLRIMDRRALSLGGWFRIEPMDPSGTVVTAWVPTAGFTEGRFD